MIVPESAHAHQHNIDHLYSLFGSPTGGAFLWKELTISERHIILGLAHVKPRHAGLKIEDLNSFNTESRLKIRKTIRMLHDITARFSHFSSSEF